MPLDFRAEGPSGKGGSPGSPQAPGSPGPAGAGGGAGLPLDARAVREREASSAPARRTLAIGVVALVLLVLAVVLPTGLLTANAHGMTLAQWAGELRRRVEGLVSLATFQGASYSMDFVLCRYLVVALAGGALAISGAVYQGSLKNALASPSTLGVMTGCNLGRILYVLLFANASGLVLSGVTISDVSAAFEGLGPLRYLAAVYGMALCSLACGFAVVALVLGVSTVAGHGRTSSVVMVVVGQVVASVIGAVVGLVQYYFTYTGDYRAELLRTLQVESFTNTFRPVDVLLVGVPVGLCLAVVMAQRSRLNLLAMREEEARSMGVSTRRSRWLTVGACTALTAVVVAFCGQVGMVGFVVPHLARRIVGPDQRYLVPASGLAGAAFLVAAYYLTTLFGASAQSTLGVFVSIFGGVVFLVVAVKQRGRGNGDWG